MRKLCLPLLEIQYQGPSDQGAERCPCRFVYMLLFMCVNGGLGKPFSRIVTETEGPRLSKGYGNWKTSYFFSEAIFAEVGRPPVCGGRSAVRARSKSHRWTQ